MTKQNLTEQPVPEHTVCPACGAKPTDESKINHRLSNMGYLHDDISFECTNDDCGERWVCGVPINADPDRPTDLRCACGDWYFVHRVRPKGERIMLDLKCNQCRSFTQVWRDIDHRGISLVGYPHLTGETAGAKPYGWTADPFQSDGP